MKIKTVGGRIPRGWMAKGVIVTLLGLTGCVVEPGRGVAYVGPPVVVESAPVEYVAPAPVYVAPAPVVVEPQLVVPIPIFIGGGGGRYRR